ncbi:MAG: hypothetical protein ACP5GX_03790 [Anaerolineae bacterium]
MTHNHWIYYDETPRSDLALFFHAVRFAGRDLFEQMYILALANLAAMWLFIVPPLFPPALAGLWSGATEVARAEELTFRKMWEAAREHFIKSWVLGALNALVYGVVVMNLLFYARDTVPLPFEASPVVISSIQAAWTVVGLIWSVFWLYAAGWFVFEEPRLGPAFKNALRLMVEHPLYTLLLIVLVGAVIAVNTIIIAFVFFLTWAFLALISVRSVQLLVHGIPEEIPPEALDQQEDL